MSFDTDYPNRKDKRKPYRGAKSFARSCRCGGSCGWCRGNRTIGTQRLEQKAKELSTSNAEEMHVPRRIR